jgi:hypothetical protein
MPVYIECRYYINQYSKIIQGDIMSKRILKQAMGCVIVSMVFLFAFSATAQAAAKKTTLNTLLKNSGITFKLAPLNRTDGFLFGFSFKGKNIPAITIAPGLGRTLLVQVNGNDMIFQGDGSGTMQVIQADGDLSSALCILTAVIDFLTGLQTSQGDPVGLFTQIISLVTTITSCSAGTVSPAL